MNEPFIFRTSATTGAGRRVARYFIETEAKPFSCSYPPVYRQVGRTVAGMRTVEQVPGRYDRDKLRFAVGGSIGYQTRLTKDAIDSQLRHVRPQELEALACIDEQIALLQVQRREAVERAWQKGHVVTLSELEQRAKARLEAVESTRREVLAERRREAGAARVED